MRIPLTRYGLPQVAVYPASLLIVMTALFIIFFPAIWLIPVLLILFAVLIWMFSFFRDPGRKIAYDEKVLYSPADATITDIDIVHDTELGAKALRIGMFLSVFNVHVNRFPCSARVQKITYRKGKFKNAMSKDAYKLNESNDAVIVRLDEPKEKLIVRQITGAVARRIVCEAKEGGEYRQGEQYGMMKFGSRAELYITEGDHYEVLVKLGDPVRAGLTPLIRYKA